MRAAVLVLCGCVAYDETVHVRLRDPDGVAVSASTPTGERLLLAQGAKGDAPVPPTVPPYTEDAREGATVIRLEGPTVASCTWCAGNQQQTVVRRTGDGGEIDLPGSPAVVSRAGDTLRMRYAYIAPLPCHRHSGLCDRPAFELLLDTNRDNVLGIDFERRVAKAHGEVTGAKIALGVGITFAALGLAGIGYYDLAGEAPNRTAKLAVLGVGGAFTLVGGMFTVLGAATLHARDSDERIAVP